MAAILRLTPGGSVKFTPKLGAASGEHHQITVPFDPPALPAGATLTRYEYTTDGGTTWHNAGTTSPLVLTGLSDGVTYNVALRSVVSVVGVPTGTVTAAVPLEAPDAPTGVSVAPGDGELTVTFTAPADDGGMAITGYQVSTDGGTTWAAAAASPATVSGLTNGTAYTVKVRAINSVGAGAASAGVSATPAVPGFTDLFDGTTIDGRWAQIGGTWQVADGYASIATQTGPDSTALTALLASTGSAEVDIEWELAAPISGGNVWNFLVASDAAGSTMVDIILELSGLSVWGWSAYPSGAWYGGTATTKNVAATRYRATIDADNLLTVYDWTGGAWVSRVTTDLTGKMGGACFGPAARAFAYSNANPHVTEVKAVPLGS